MPDIHEAQVDNQVDTEASVDPAPESARSEVRRTRRRTNGEVPNLLAQATVPMTVLAQDPDVTGRRGPVTVGIPVPSSRLQRGPANHRFHVVDVGARGTPAEEPVGLTARGRPWQYVDLWARAPRKDLASARKFRAQNVFAIAAHTLALFERHLGRRVPWRSGWPQLYLVPKAMLGANAAYTPDQHAIVFGYLPKLGDNQAAYACLSYDVIAHEVTHAVLDGLRPRYVEPGLPDQMAFHEALADLVALLSVFELKGVAERLLLEHSHDRRIHFPSDEAAASIKDKKDQMVARIAGRRDRLKQTALLGLGEQLGRARALRNGEQDLGPGRMPLRRSVDLEPDPNLLDQDEYAEPHRRAEILVAAVMRTLAGIWASRIDALDSTDGLDAARVAEEGVRAAGQLLGMVLRSLDYLPPVELEFADVVDCIVTADKRLVPDDDLNYRETLKAAFRDFGIEPPHHRMLDEDGLAAPAPQAARRSSRDPDAPSDRIRYEHLNFAALRTSPEEVFSFIWNNAGTLEIDVRLATRVDRVITSTRAGIDGLIVTEILADYSQWIGTTGGHLPEGMVRPEGLPEDADVEMWGGGVLVFDQFGRFRLHQRKPVLDITRQQRRLDNLVERNIHDRDGGFGTTDGTSPDERFALLHELVSEDSW